MKRLHIPILRLSLLASSMLHGQQGPAPETWKAPDSNLTWATHDSGKDLTHKKAHEYCQALTLAGMSGWRLATVEELAVMYDVSASRVDTKHKTYHIAGGIVLTNSWSWSNSPSSKTGFFAYRFSDKGRKFPAMSGPFSLLPALCVHD